MAESDFLFSKLLHAVKKKRKERRMEEDRKRKKETSFYNFQAPSSKMSRKKQPQKPLWKDNGQKDNMHVNGFLGCPSPPPATPHPTQTHTSLLAS